MHGHPNVKFVHTHTHTHIYTYIYIHIYIQDIHKRMMRFQKFTRNLFLTLHSHNVHRQQQQLSKFLARYQQFAFHAYCGAAGPRGQFPRWRRSRKRLSVCCVLRCPDVCRVTQGAHIEGLWFSCVNHNPSMCAPWVTRHTSGHLKTEHTESLFLLRCHLGNWPRGPSVSMSSELLVAREKLGQLLLLMVYVVPVYGDK